MLDGQGNVRITDFGLAGLADALAGEDVRSGTPAYMSPEQLAGREVTVRSDIYALGLVLYELLTGRRAFEGKGLAELARKHRDERPSSPRSSCPRSTRRSSARSSPASRRTRAAPAVRSRRRRHARRPRPARGGDRRRGDAVAGAGGRGGRVRGPAPAGGLGLPRSRSSRRPAPRPPPGAAQLLAGPVDKPPAALEDRARELSVRLGHTARGGRLRDGLSSTPSTSAGRAQDRSPAAGTELAHRGPAGPASGTARAPGRSSPRPERPRDLGRPAAARLGDGGGEVRPPRDGCRALVGAAAGGGGARPAPARRTGPRSSPRRGSTSRGSGPPPRWTPPFHTDARAAWEGPGRAGPTSPSASRRPHTAAGRCGSRS